MGASARTDSMGEWALKNLQHGAFKGTIYAVNPAYRNVGDFKSYASISELPERPDLVIFALGDQRVEAALDEAIAFGVPAAVIMSSLILDDDADPPLKERVREKINAAGMLVCGANGMGFYNVRDQVWACGFDSTGHTPPGNISIISHSGAGMSGIIDSDERLQINFAVSTGNELSVSMDEYLDFVLDLPETRVVGLFIETARNPAGFRAALEKAAARGIPIVALKTGRTSNAAKLAVSHSGAMAGDDAVYDALFERYGVQRATDQDEWASTLILFAELHPVGNGGLVSLHDSGGERQLLVDLADAAGVPLTELQPETVAALKKLLPPELPAVNPLDAWSRGGEDASEYMAECFAVLTSDPGAALGAVLHDRAPNGEVYQSYLDYMQHARQRSAKPVALVAARQGTGHDPAVISMTRAGYPVLDGVWSFLGGVRALFAYRDFQQRAAQEPPATDEQTVRTWRERLIAAGTLDEFSALAMLEDFGIATSRPVLADCAESTAAAASQLGYPVVLKTAMPGILHKTEHDAVETNLKCESDLLASYERIAGKLGPKVLVAPMVKTGSELFLGVKRDPQFGPVVLIGFGGILAETIGDVRFALPPFSESDAHRYLDSLKLRPILDGMRGAEPANIEHFCLLAARFSAMVHALRHEIAEFDVNPLIVNADGAVAVDALVIAAKG